MQPTREAQGLPPRQRPRPLPENARRWSVGSCRGGTARFARLAEMMQQKHRARAPEPLSNCTRSLPRAPWSRTPPPSWGIVEASPRRPGTTREAGLLRFGLDERAAAAKPSRGCPSQAAQGRPSAPGPGLGALSVAVRKDPCGRVAFGLRSAVGWNLALRLASQAASPDPASAPRCAHLVSPCLEGEHGGLADRGRPRGGRRGARGARGPARPATHDEASAMLSPIHSTGSTTLIG